MAYDPNSRPARRPGGNQGLIWAVIVAVLVIIGLLVLWLWVFADDEDDETGDINDADANGEEVIDGDDTVIDEESSVRGNTLALQARAVRSLAAAGIDVRFAA